VFVYSDGGEIKINISKSYLLMALNEEKGICYSRGFESLGFAGALLMDLYLQGKITTIKGIVEIADSSSTGDEILDQILEIIKNSEKNRSLMSWIDRISQKYDFYYLFFDLMERQGILKSDIVPELKTKLYSLQKPKIKSELLDKIHNVVDSDEEPSINTICLLVLLEESKLIKVYFPRDFRKKLRNRIKVLFRSELLDSSKREMILGIRKEIVKVIGARNMFLTDEA